MKEGADSRQRRFRILNRLAEPGHSGAGRCQGKVVFATHAIAELAAKELGELDGRRFETYLCHVDGEHFHLESRNPAVPESPTRISMRRGFLEEILGEPDGIVRRADLLEKLDYMGSMRNRLCRLRALIKMYEDIGIVQREGVNSVRLIDRTAAENLLRQIKAGKEMTMRNRAANDKYRETAERLRNYDLRPDRTVEESNRLEQEKYEASKHASWWLRWNRP